MSKIEKRIKNLQALKSVGVIIGLFLIWRIYLFLVAWLASFWLPNFAARFPYYQELLVSTGLPDWIWGFANFDGVHYITIAAKGYSAQFTQAFFPLYPLLIKILAFNQHYLLTGLFISNVFFILSLLLLFLLFIKDYPQKVSLKALILLLSFPTAYYFGAVYSESLFLFLVVITFLLLREKRYVWAGILGGFASATRIFGIMLIPAFLVELFNNLKNWGLRRIFQSLILLFASILVFSGLLIYMFYLGVSFGDPIYFLHSQPAFGASRSDQPFILLPQVLYRYFKIFLSVPIFSLAFFNAALEVIFTMLPLTLLALFWRRIRLDYAIFTLGILLLPTLTGTLSSMPRYSLMSFLLFPELVRILGRFYIIWVVLSLVLQFCLLGMFIRGYWVG